MKDLWWRGSFPRAYLAKSDKACRQWHEDFFRTFLERDIPQLGITISATTLRRFAGFTMALSPFGSRQDAARKQ